MKKTFAILVISLSLGAAGAVRCFGDTVLMTDLNESNIGSYNFGAGDWFAMAFQTGSSAISVQQINILMQQYQPVADEPFVAIYTVNSSDFPLAQVSGALFNPQLPLTSTMGINTFDPLSPVTLQANTTYDVVVGANILNGYWAWGLESGTGEAGPGGSILPISSEQFPGWQSLGATFGFDLEGTVVPEPSTVALIVLGACVLGKRCLKRDKSS